VGPPADLRHLSGPFDIVGDVHGCAGELAELLERLGYRVCGFAGAAGSRVQVIPPSGRRAVFVGDLVDRGPDSPAVLRIVMAMVEAGTAFCIPGNHDDKFLRWLDGRAVTINHGLDTTIRQMEAESGDFRLRVQAFLDSLPIYLQLDGGGLVIAHAGIRASMIGRDGKAIRSFCLYGDTDGKTDAHGLALRYHWALQHAGVPNVVYGHTPVDSADWVNGTLCIDTGCVFGGALTALRWPEREIVTIPAKSEWAKRLRPFGHPPAREM
jgi:protein phosphatase